MASPLWHLTLARFREFYREPAALFWVYGFPLILAFVLGWRFASSPCPPPRWTCKLTPNIPSVRAIDAGARRRYGPEGRGP